MKMALKVKSFAQPDLLKRIRRDNLLRLLEPHRPFFEMKGFSLSGGNDGEIGYLALAGILAQPDEEMPSDLVMLHIVGNFSGDEHFDGLLEMADEKAGLMSDKAGFNVVGDTTTPDLAARLNAHCNRRCYGFN
jgi:hypothetical protein